MESGDSDQEFNSAEAENAAPAADTTPEPTPAGDNAPAGSEATSTELHSDSSAPPAEVAVAEATSDSSFDAAEAPVDEAKTNELSSDFVGRWTTLISTTNWEKGKIIYEWRDALMGSESPSSTYSDDAWAQRVGGVTPQHVGRLRRVYDRFGNSYESFSGLYWSHFLAALDWDDAEMWLEGATQSKWSVSQMRRTRWESQGGDPQQEPQETEIVSASVDEDFTPLAEVEEDASVQDDSRSVAEGPRDEGPDFGDESEPTAADGSTVDDDALPWEGDAEVGDPIESPFANLPSLPVDMAEALEQFKLSIIRHRSDSWSEVAQGDVLQAVDALRAFAAQ